MSSPTICWRDSKKDCAWTVTPLLRSSAERRRAVPMLGVCLCGMLMPSSTFHFFALLLSGAFLKFISMPLPLRAGKRIS